MSGQTMLAPVDEEQVLAQLEAAFLRTPASCPAPSEIDLAESLAPVISRVEHDPVCRITRVKTRRWCCDY